MLSSKTKKCANRAAHCLRMTAYSLQRSNSAIGAFLRRIKGRLGPAKVITATAHKIARIILIYSNMELEYKDVGQDDYEHRYKKRMIENLKRRASQFGCELTFVKEQQQDIKTIQG